MVLPLSVRYHFCGAGVDENAAEGKLFFLEKRTKKPFVYLIVYHNVPLDSNRSADR